MDDNSTRVLRTLIVCGAIVGGLAVFMYFLTQIVHDLTDKKWWEIAIPAACGLCVSLVTLVLRRRRRRY